MTFDQKDGLSKNMTLVVIAIAVLISLMLTVGNALEQDWGSVIWFGGCGLWFVYVAFRLNKIWRKS